jgi:hypothetical protein
MKLTPYKQFTPFKLEDLIMECWQVTSDIKVVYEEHLDSPTPMNDDELANILIGMEYMYQRKFERLFREYEAVCNHGGIFLDEDDVKAIKEQDENR